MSLTLTEARARAAAVCDVTYDIALDLTDPTAELFGCTTRVGFTARADATFLELARGRDVVVVVDGVPRADCYRDGRVLLEGLGGAADRPRRVEVVVEAALPYVSDGDGMHRVTDPADGATYVAAYVGMDVAQRVFACFDQNDLKASWAVRVAADPTWTVLANGAPSGPDGGEPDQPGAWSFVATPPLPPAMFVVCAGPWASRTWEHRGLPMGWHARGALADDLDRDLDDLRRTTEACLDHYAELFTEPMPFAPYHQAFVPGQNWGALETPGCVTYRDEYLPRGTTTPRQRARRATTIAHEMSHMWFGDLVTMTWWEDTWLQESFADYMGYRVAEDAVGHDGVRVEFELSRKLRGYEADARPTTHPVAPEAEDVPDVDAAATNFDMISYAKGHAVLRQLVTWLGDDVFLAGVNGYLARHRFGNARLADFVAALDEVSDRDVVAWADSWLRAPGYDVLRVERDDDGVPVLHRDGPRPHRVSVAAFDDDLRPAGSELVDLPGPGGGPVRLEQWAGRAVLPNAGSETFAALELDATSRAALLGGLSSLADPLARAVLWSHLLLAVEHRRAPVADLLRVVEAHLPHETEADVVGAVLARVVGRVVPLRVSAAAAPDALGAVEAACLAGLDVARTPDLRRALVEGLTTVGTDAQRLTGWLGTGTAEGVELTRELRWDVLARLAALGAADADLVDAEHRADDTVEGALGAARALAARPTPEAKQEAWAEATEHGVSNRRFTALLRGLWQPDQAELVAPQVDAYLEVGPSLAGRGQAFAQVVGRCFPSCALTAEHLDRLASQLGAGVPTALRRSWADALHDRR